jgi:hypothetical protein
MSERTELLTERTRSLASVGLALLPVTVAGVRAAAGSWVPIGDDAYFTARSMDVATVHHPLVGAWSSGSADISRQVNNLGPLQLDLLAPFTKIAPMGGTAIGVVTVHIAAIITIAWLVYRLAGHRAVVPAMAAVSMLTWVLGSEVLVAARQHQYLVVPYLCVLVAAWAATVGDRWALVPFVAAGSLVTQTHLSYPILVAALGVVVIVGQSYAARERGLQNFRVPWTIAVVLAALLWVQTAIDQVFGWGNLGDVLASPGEATSPGLGAGFRIVAHVIVAARGYVRPGFGLYDPDAGIAGDGRTALFVVVLALAAIATAVAFRQGRRLAGSGLLVALVAMCAAVIDAASLPITQFGETGLTAANHRWLWSTTAFLVLGAFVAVQHYVTAVWPGTDSRFALLPPIVLLGFVVANLPSSQQVYDPALQREHVRVTAELTRQLSDVELAGPVLVDQSHLYFGQPFGYPVVVVLRDRGIDFRLEGEMQARRFGESRVSDGSEPERLVLWHAAEALDRLDAPNLVAYVPGPDPLVVLLEKDDGS